MFGIGRTYRMWRDASLTPVVWQSRTSKINDQYYAYRCDVTRPSGVTSTSSTGVVAYRDVLSGIANPKWRSAVRAGNSATTSMIAVREHAEILEYGDATFWYRDPISPNLVAQVDRASGVYHYALFGLSNPLPVDSVSIENIALSRLFAALKKESQQMSGPTFLGELRETIGMIRRPMKNVFKSMDSYLFRCGSIASSARKLKNRARRASYVAKAISDAWLECTFGIAPAISDARDIATTIARMQYDIRHTRARGYGEGKNVASYKDALEPYYLSRVLLNRNVRYEQTYQVIWTAGLKQALDAPFTPAQRLVALTGFNFREFVPTVYELVPSSCVVDYFTNIGDMLQASLTTRDRVSWSQRTVRNHVIAKVELPLSSTRPDLLIRWSGNMHAGKTLITRATVNRSTPPLEGPTFEYRLPGIRQFVNLGALLVSKSQKLTATAFR